MKEREPQVLDLEKIIRSRAGSKAKYIPQFLINWFKKIAHQDYINGYLKEGYVGVDFCENCLGYLGVEIEVKGLENLPDDGRVYTFASNHPLGAIDGVTLGAIIGRKYDGKVKYLLNDLLMNLKGMAFRSTRSGVRPGIFQDFSTKRSARITICSYFPPDYVQERLTERYRISNGARHSLQRADRPDAILFQSISTAKTQRDSITSLTGRKSSDLNSISPCSCFRTKCTRAREGNIR